MEISELAFSFSMGASASWEMYLLKYNKKSRMYASDKVTLNEGCFKESLNVVLNFTLDKIREFQGIIPYTEGVLSDGYLCSMDKADERIAFSYQKLYESMLNAGAEVRDKYNGYILRGNTEEGREILIINMTNPLTSVKNLLLVPENDSLKDDALIRMSKRCDILVVDDAIYGDTKKIEAIFGLSSTPRAICEANRKMVVDSKVFTESASAMFMNPRLLRSFSYIDENALSNLKEKNESAMTLKKYAEMEYLSDGSLALLTDKAAKLVIKYLSGHIVERDGQCFIASTLEPLTPIEN